MKVLHSLRMDLARCGCRPIVAAVQGEANTRVLVVSLFDNGIAWAPPEGTTAAVAFQKPDGTKGLYDTLPDGATSAVTIDGSVATAILAPQVLTCAGTVLASIVFYDEDLDTLATFPFKITVEANPAAGEQISNNFYYMKNLNEVNAAYQALLDRIVDLEALGAGLADAVELLGVYSRTETVHGDDSTVTAGYSVNGDTGLTFPVSNYVMAKLPISFDYNTPITVRTMLGDSHGVVVTDDKGTVLFSACGKNATNYGCTNIYTTLQEITFNNPENAAFVYVCASLNYTANYTQPSDLWVRGTKSNNAVQKQFDEQQEGIAKVTEEVSVLQQKIGVYSRAETVHGDNSTVTNGYGVNGATGLTFPNNNYVMAKLPISFDYNAPITVNSMFGDTNGISVTDANGTVLLSISGDTVKNYGGTATYTTLQEITFNNPENAAFVYVCASLAYTANYTQPSDLWVRGTKSNNAVQKQFDEINGAIGTISTAEVTAFATDENVIANTRVHADTKTLYAVEKYVSAKIPIEFDYNTPITVRGMYGDNIGILVVDANDDVLFSIAGTEAIKYGGTTTYTTLQELTFNNPENAAFVYVCASLAYTANYTQPSDLWVKGSVTCRDSNFVSCHKQNLIPGKQRMARDNIGAISAEDVKAMFNNYELDFDYGAYGLPILYLDGDISAMTKDVAVDLQYRYKDLSGKASVKWQGNSSLQYPKKNYTVKFDTAFEAADGWGAQKKYCVKANYIDFTHCRNVVSAKLWGQIVASRNPANASLAACPNYGAVDGFPVCIVMNGKYYGVYTFNIPKDGWMMNMGSGTKECILCADAHTASNAFKGEATLDGDFEIEYITDKNNTDWARTSINNLINACINSDGNNLDTTIATMLDWESAIDYYIFVALLRGDDMITKNYLISTYDGTKWFFGAYDLDSTYGLHWDGKYFMAATSGIKFKDIAGMHRVFELVRTYKKAELKARYKKLRSTVMSEDNVGLTFRNFAGTISRPLLDEDNRKWPGIPSTNANNLSQLLDWYRLRVAFLDAEIESM